MRSTLVPIFLLALTAPLLAEEPNVHGKFEVTLDPDEDILQGRGTLRFQNTSERPVSVLPLVLYGARFREKDDRITDRNFDYYYVRWFDSGDMLLTKARVGGVDVARNPDPHPELPKGAVVALSLPKPLAPGDAVELELEYTLELPHRLGPFGERRGCITLEAGWLPYIPHGFDPRKPPLLTRWELTVRSPIPILLDGRPPPAEGPLRVDAEAVPLLAGDQLHELVSIDASDAEPAVTVYGEEGDNERAQEIVKLARTIGAYLHDSQGIEPGSVSLAPAPLRDRFIQVAGDRTILYSDRLFHVFLLLQRFHEAEIVRGVLQALVRQATRDLPLGPDRDWVCEAAGWTLSRDWMQRRAGLKAKHIHTGLEWLSFIPSIDRVVRAPRFSGSDLYYGRFYEPLIAVPDGFNRALSGRARGRVVAEKLRDRLGEERFAQLFSGLFEGGPRQWRGAFRDRATKLAGEPLQSFFDLWLGQTPKQNLRIKDVETLSEDEKGTSVRVHLKRDTEDARIGVVGDPVTVEGTGPDGEKVRAQWNGLGEEGQVELRLENALWNTVRIDPDHRVLQTIYADDVEPHLPIRILLNRFRVRFDLNNGNRNEAAIGLTLHPRFDYAHAVTLDTFYEQDERGIATNYSYSFGRVLDERRYGTSVGFGLTATRVNEGILRTGPETTGEFFSVNAGIGFDTRRSRVNPSWGVGLNFGVEYADQWFGTDFRFLLYRGGLAFVTSIVRGTTIGVELKLGQTEGDADTIPSQRLFDAGGERTLRGVRTSDFVDTALVAIRGEVRHMVIEDLDIPLLWVAWLRKIQLVAFLDTGDVGETIEDIVRYDTFWKWGAGAGIRIYMDAFGVSNLTARFDVAVRIDDGDENDREPQFYVGVNQSF